jgi:hypothetical protein
MLLPIIRTNNHERPNRVAGRFPGYFVSPPLAALDWVPACPALAG